MPGSARLGRGYEQSGCTDNKAVDAATKATDNVRIEPVRLNANHSPVRIESCYMELVGLEPTTFALPARRSPS